MLKIDRVKEVWNKKATNKIKLTIIKSENNWLKLKFIIHLINLDKLKEIAWEIQKSEGFVL